MTLLMRRDPTMRDLWGMQRDFDRLMSVFASSSPSSASFERPEFAIPSVDVIRRGEDLVYRAEMPGITSEDIDIAVVDGLLTLKGTRRTESETSETDYVVRETTYGSFERTMQLPAGLDPKSIQAEYRDGILEIVVPGAATPIEPAAVHIPIASHVAEKSESTH